MTAPTTDQTITALCAELSKLRAENIGLRRTIDQRDGTIADLHAQVAVANGGAR